MIKIDKWLFYALCEYFTTEDEKKKEILESAIKDGLLEKLEKIKKRSDYQKKHLR